MNPQFRTALVADKPRSLHLVEFPMVARARAAAERQIATTRRLTELARRMARTNDAGARALKSAPLHDRLASALLSILGSAATPTVAYVAACRCFKALESSRVSQLNLAALLNALIDAFDRPIAHPGLRTLIGDGDACVASVPGCRDLAARWEIGHRGVSRVVFHELGIGLTRLRIALRCRSVITQLLATDMQIAQIAYACGYRHASQLDHDFDRLFGLSPRAFRDLGSPCSRSSLLRIDQIVNKSVK